MSLGQCQVRFPISCPNSVLILYQGAPFQFISETRDNQFLIVCRTLVSNCSTSQIQLTESTFIGKFTTIQLSGTINGLVQDWMGELTMILVGPNTNITHTVNITSDWEHDLNFTPDTEGEFEVFMHITGIPLGMQYNDSMTFSVGPVPIEIMLDTGTTPILGGGGILFALGLLVRRRLNGTMDLLPGEWE